MRLLYARTKAVSKDKFAKSHENMWTTEIYSVVDRAGPNSFIVDVGSGEVPVWPLHALQIVRKALRTASPAGEKVDKKVVRAQRLEVRSISTRRLKRRLRRRRGLDVSAPLELTKRSWPRAHNS